MRDWQGGLLASALIYGGIIATPATSAYVAVWRRAPSAGAVSRSRTARAFSARSSAPVRPLPGAASLGYRELFAIALSFLRSRPPSSSRSAPRAASRARAFRPPRAFWVFSRGAARGVATIVSPSCCRCPVEVAAFARTDRGLCAASCLALRCCCAPRTPRHRSACASRCRRRGVLTLAAGMCLVPDVASAHRPGHIPPGATRSQPVLSRRWRGRAAHARPSRFATTCLLARRTRVAERSPASSTRPIRLRSRLRSCACPSARWSRQCGATAACAGNR